MERGVVLRAGELFLKGANRATFERALERRVREVLARYGGLELVRGQGRLFVRGGEPPGLLDRLAEVFGASSLSPVVFVPQDLEPIAGACVEMGREALAEGARTFRISARRADKRFPMTSLQLNVELGARVARETGMAVDLTAADADIVVELGPAASFLCRRVRQGAGGLPVGVSGKAALLLSGGIDSPVAGHLAQKRGLELLAVHFHSAPWTSAASQEKVRRLAMVLARRQSGVDLHMVPFGPIQQRLREAGDEAYRVILYRRFMLRIAEAIAARERASALVTGDSLGQVASQTLENLACIGAATSMLILRPLVGFDKAEVIELGRRLGTYETSIEPHDDCCSLFVPRHPETRGRASRVARIEESLETADLVERAIAATTVERVEGAG